MDWAKTTAKRDEKYFKFAELEHLILEIWWYITVIFINVIFIWRQWPYNAFVWCWQDKHCWNIKIDVLWWTILVLSHFTIFSLVIHIQLRYSGLFIFSLIWSLKKSKDHLIPIDFAQSHCSFFIAKIYLATDYCNACIANSYFVECQKQYSITSV